ncbi:MAG: HAMP domain-containing protein [Dorea sp.]|jgi:two-component system sensor histidine kinase VanS|nr:HAMP domain-containing protein [Dorea sp.]
MKYSIKSQMIAIFVGLTGCLLFALLFINMNFLEPYYVSQKEDAFIKMYARLKGAMESGSIETQEELEEIWQIAENNNLSYLIVDETYSRMFTNVNDMDMLKRQLAGYMLNQAQKTGKVLESTEEYEIARSRNPWNKEEYIEMWGTFDDGSVFLIRSPIESIKESAEISNRFLIYIGCAAVAVCILFIWYFSKRLTAPILELAALSERMANLDFNAKYTSGGSNEIGNLGDNFNRMSERLESAISELKSANNRLLKDIEQKEKLEQMRNDFLGNVSHELKTPIALIQGYAEGLKEGVKDDAESREFYCDVIMDEAAKMNQMVRSLLELNQLEFGDEKMKFERFDLTELVRGILQSMDILAQQDGVEVIFRQETPVYVWADEYKVEQVVRNYVSNAFHHVSLEKIIEVKIKILQDKARVTVFNTGTAIPEEDVGRIWDKFYKVDKAHTREYGGNGIGLSIVKAIMESFRQKYGVINYDNGVEFWFELDVK